VQRQDFSYDLPPELIAQAPLAERSASRLLVLDGGTGAIQDRAIRDLPELLTPGDVLVFNDTRVVAARIVGAKPTGGRVEIFLERALAESAALVQLRASKAIRPELEILTPGGTVRVIAPHGDLWEVRVPGETLAFFERWGEVPLPPYIRRAPDEADRSRYQTVFAREPGAVAAPTASLHFDESLLASIAARGVEKTFITLHVGAGTFQPIRSDSLDEHVMHAEHVSVGADACDAIQNVRARGGRVVAVGTTVARALESAAINALTTEARDASMRPAAAPIPLAAHTPLPPWSGDTSLFIRPGFSFKVVDALLTNFHLPESTLLMLVSAFAGRDRVLAAYRHAVGSRYRFFSYGDAMFVTPSREIAR
jgi:S-adenosylmethionine:tRNA ribosyltransferase-isomerase